MASETRKVLEDLNLSQDELQRLTEAFKKEEFRKLFKEYADEISDPENRRKYEEEIKILENERGFDVKFVHPKPGYVVKTTVNGERKAFINVCTNDNVEKPASQQKIGPDGKRGLAWTIPHSFAPPRDDVDKNGNKCQVFDFVVHPDTYRMAETNNRFKAMIQETAFDGIERQFDVKLDRKNLRFPKMKFKGTPMATVIRTKGKDGPKERDPDDILNSLPYPYDDKTSEEKARLNEEAAAKRRESKKNEKGSKPKKDVEDDYTIPKYTIKHRSEIDFQDYRNARDAKISTRPNELCIEIDLPLLKSAAPVELDIFEKSLVMKSENPAKYKLKLDLPYPVNENQGSAKFDKNKRQLSITLPVLPIKEPVNIPFESCSLQNDDNEHVSDENLNTDVLVEKPLIEVLSSEVTKENDEDVPPLEDVTDDESCASQPLSEVPLHGEVNGESSQTTNGGSYTNESQHPSVPKEKQNELLYTLPGFDYHQDDETVSIILHAGKVDRSTVQMSYPSSNEFKIQMTSVGSGGFPIDYSFYARFPESCTLETENCRADVDTHNVVVILVKTDEAIGPWEKFVAGLDADNLEEKLFLTKKNLLKQLSDLRPENDIHNTERTISPEIDVTEMDSDKLVINFKDHSRTRRKKRLSESADDIEVIHQHEVPPLRGIIKHRSVSESSDDLCSYTRHSSTASFNGSESSLLDSDENWDGTVRKKSVSFSEHVDQTVYKSSQSVCSMKATLKNRRKNQRKRERKHAEKENRRRRKSSGSEGASSDETGSGDKQPSGSAASFSETTNAINQNLSSSPDYDAEGDDEGSPTVTKVESGTWPKTEDGIKNEDKDTKRTNSVPEDVIDTKSVEFMPKATENSKGNVETSLNSTSADCGSISDATKTATLDSANYDTLLTSEVHSLDSTSSAGSSASEVVKNTVDSGVSDDGDSLGKEVKHEDIDSDDDPNKESSKEKTSSLIEELDPKISNTSDGAKGANDDHSTPHADTMLSWEDGMRSAEHSTKCAFNFNNSVVFDLDVD